MVKELFYKQRQYLEYFFAHLDMRKCDEIFHHLKASKGVFFFTGVGKSGFVAQKVAATMLSTGTKAFYLSPIDALHGDLGMLSKDDVLIIFSKSGETEELLHLLPHVRSKGAKTLAVTSNPQSRLMKGADYSLELPCTAELCPFDLAPTISTAIQLLFGDVLAIALMQSKSFSLEEFAQNHPAGRIGRRATVKVKDLMLAKEKTPLCRSSNRLEEVLVDFTDKRCGCMVVVDEVGKLKGIFTDGDLRRALQAKGEKVLKERLGDLMSAVPKSIESEHLAIDAMKLMESDQKRPFTVLPVLEKDQVVGLIKMHDIIQAGL
jgi:arabinose-5-phosphate isomerase